MKIYVVLSGNKDDADRQQGTFFVDLNYALRELLLFLHNAALSDKKPTFSPSFRLSPPRLLIKFQNSLFTL